MSERMVAHPLQLVVGFALWLLWLVVLYGATAGVCKADPPVAAAGALGLVHIALVLWTVVLSAGFAVAAGVHARAAARLGPGETEGAPLAGFVMRTAAWLYGGCTVATLVVGLPLLTVPPCV